MLPVPAGKNVTNGVGIRNNSTVTERVLLPSNMNTTEPEEQRLINFSGKRVSKDYSLLWMKECNA